MTRALRKIAELVSPPTSPRGLDRSWDVVEKELGLILPDEYKEFIDTYGTGQISSAKGGWIVIWNFRATSLFKSPLGEMLCGEGSVTQLYRNLARDTDYPCPYPIYPEPGGLLPYAAHRDVHNLNWLTKGRPNRWKVVYWHSDGIEFTRLEDTFGRCLLKILCGEYSGLERPSSLEPPFNFGEWV